MIDAARGLLRKLEEQTELKFKANALLMLSF